MPFDLRPADLLRMALMPRKMVAQIVSAEQRIAQLRLVADMSEADAYHWFALIAAIARSSTLPVDDFYRMFIRRVTDGASPLEAAAYVAASTGIDI